MDVVRHLIQRQVNGQQVIVGQQIAADGQGRHQQFHLAVPDVGHHIGKNQQHQTVIVEIQPVDQQGADHHIQRQRHRRPWPLMVLQPQNPGHKGCRQNAQQHHTEQQVRLGVRRNGHHVIQKGPGVVLGTDALGGAIDEKANGKDGGTVEGQHGPLEHPDAPFIALIPIR